MDRGMAVILGAVVLILGLIILGPLVTILALNTLFGLGIPFTFGTWLAALWLGVIVYGSRE